MRKHFVVDITFLLFAFLFISNATTRKVPQDYAKIQLAINSAVNGDTVLVAEGAYIENIVINKKIILASQFYLDKDTSHISKTIIDGSAPTHADSGTVVVLALGTDSTTLVTGFTITKGSGMKLPWGNLNTRYGGGVVLTESGGGTIRKNIISKNTITVPANALGGAAGIAVWPGNLQTRTHKAIIEDNVIENNSVSPLNTTSQTEVGGMAVWQGYCRITGNVVRNNTVQWLHQTSSCTGGGILVDSESGGNDTMIVIGNTVVGNKSRQGGGITVGGNGTRALIQSNTVIGNTGDIAGGGIFLFYKLVYAKVINNYISKNISPQGGGIRVDQASICYIANNIITQNTASMSGGGINLISSSNIQLVNNTIVGNSNNGVEAINGASAQAFNNIIWNNTPSPMTGTISSLNNLTTDPKFTQNDSLYSLSSISPAIGAGSTSATVGVVLLTAPAIDYSGSSRPNPAWSNPDLGSMESSRAFPGGNAIRVPQDQSTIQKGINAAQNGDVVLVSEGTYKENIVITKKITVASLYFIDKDTSHISKTIIDGSSPSSVDSAAVVTIDGSTDTTTMIIGFTVSGGRGNRRVTTDPLVYRTGTGIDVAGGGATIRKNFITANNVTASTNVSAVVNIWDVTDTKGISFVIVEDNIISDNVLNGAPSVEGGALAIGHNSRIIGNRILRNSIIGKSAGFGAAAQIWNGTITFERNLIANNYASTWGGAIQTNLTGGMIILLDNIIANNSAGVQGGAIWARWATSKVFSINNTIIGNTSPTGSGLYFRDTASFTGINTLLWNTGGSEISTVNNGRIALSYSDVQFGFAGTGNINSDPLLNSTNIDSLGMLKSGSPCINAGSGRQIVSGSVLTAPLIDFYGNIHGVAQRPDIGAVEDGTFINDPTWGVKELFTNRLPEAFELSQNYPNPFNPSTTIRYALPSSSQVKLVIYDLLGREITTLVDEEQSAGWKEVQWNGSAFSSGIYFYKLQAGDFVEVKKLMLLK
jgi:parallel beta-helix repeat protein